MNRCTVTTGFFVLGRCGRQALGPCASCARPVCAEHVLPGNLCTECGTARGYGQGDAYQPGWAQAYRRVYYQRASAEYRDEGWYATFDSYDRGAFEPGAAWDQGGDFGDDDGPDYVDS